MFPIQNLPFCSFRAGGHERPTEGVRIGDLLVDAWELIDAGLLTSEHGFDRDLSFSLIDDGVTTLRDLRRQLALLLRDETPTLRENHALRQATLHPVNECELLIPLEVNAFVDFYSGIHHAENVGRMFRPDQPPLLPNYRHLPVGYHGRASSVVVSGTDFHRPSGITRKGESEVSYGPTKELDFELELGFFTAGGNALGEAIPIDRVEDMILGVVLVNDWSARDVQRFEYQPLGPFLGKSFATSISPYLVTLDALEPFRIEGEPQDPAPLPHLTAQQPGHYDLVLEAWLQTERMTAPQRISVSNARYLYWSFTQQLAHLASNGTPIEAGDLYATGTISGPEPESRGSLLELSWRGQTPLTLHETGETRTFLEDGDTLILTGYGQGEGFRVGFGEVRATVLPAFSVPSPGG